MKRRRAIFTRLVVVAQWIMLGSFMAAGSDAIQTAGDVLLYAMPASAGGMALAYRDAKGALELGESLAVTVGVTYALKYSVNERRPNGESQSFPSGHASITFSSAEFVRKRYGWEYGVPAYALASFVAYSRVESGQHYAHDVIAGAGIGILSSYIFTRPYKGWTANIEGDARSVAVRLCRRF